MVSSRDKMGGARVLLAAETVASQVPASLNGFARAVCSFNTTNYICMLSGNLPYNTVNKPFSSHPSAVSVDQISLRSHNPQFMVKHRAVLLIHRVYICEREEKALRLKRSTSPSLTTTMYEATPVTSA